jgi:hypothetical protein
MYSAVKDVKPKDGYKLLLAFENGEIREFDVSVYLEIGKFKELKNKAIFDSVRVAFDSIEWSNKLDLDPELLYEKYILEAATTEPIAKPFVIPECFYREYGFSSS